MIFRKRNLVVLLFLFLFTACQATSQKEGFSDDDKAEIVQLTLERALADREIPDSTLLTAEGDELILSSENIEDVEVGEVPGFDITILSPEEIQAKADAEGDFLYLSFSRFEVETDDLVNISFGSQWAVGQGSTTGYLSGGGMEMVYERQPEGWVGEVVAVFMS